MQELLAASTYAQLLVDAVTDDHEMQPALRRMLNDTLDIALAKAGLLADALDPPSGEAQAVAVRRRR